MLDIEIGGDAIGRVRTVRKHLAGWITTATGDIAKEAGDFIKSYYLNGQALEKRTGLTYRSVKQFYVKRESAWYLRPGVGVPGSQNYLARWIGTEKEFMQPGFERYVASRDVPMRIVRKVEAKL